MLTGRERIAECHLEDPGVPEHVKMALQLVPWRLLGGLDAPVADGATAHGCVPHGSPQALCTATAPAYITGFVRTAAHHVFGITIVPNIIQASQLKMQAPFQPGGDLAAGNITHRTEYKETASHM